MNIKRTILLSLLAFVFLIAIASVNWRYTQIQTVEAKTKVEITCDAWSMNSSWSIDKCHDENDEIVCMLASSGMMQCRFQN